LHILLVDDDAPLRQMLATALLQAGYEVTAAEDVPSARRLLRSQAFSLILSDYHMPGENGLDLLQFVMQVYPDLPFILLTAQEERDLACQAIGEGAIDFLPKPCRIDQLKRLIEQNITRAKRDAERIAKSREEVLHETIRALVAAVDAKDPHTRTHSERVTRLVLRLGRTLELPDERLNLLEFAAMMHDVGKIGIPDAVLRKPGSLTPDERALIETHPVRGAEILQKVKALREAASIVRHHHERIDGGGYPDQLAGVSIPPLSRMLAVADTYEAMTADRSYRKAFSHEEACERLRKALGTQLDVAFGQAFLLLKDFE
jgi:putative two-component system response regulator